MWDDIKWKYDEFTQVGKDYSRPEEAEEYDSRHSDIRDTEQENREIMDALGIKEGDVVIDFGCGTGAFAVMAAKEGAEVYAVDVSEEMLRKAEEKAGKEGVGNIRFCHAGFLTYEHSGPPADYIVTSLALHHLPDFWKGVALKRLYKILKPGGILYIQDVVIEEENAMENISAMIDHFGNEGGEYMREDVETHFKEEFSTYDWIMDELIKHSGFKIENKNIINGVMARYLCEKT